MNLISIPEPLNYIENCLRELGYQSPSGNIVRQFIYQLPSKTAQADLIAFGDPSVSDISTACISVNYMEKDYNDSLSKLNNLHQLRYIAAPIALLASSDHVEVWPVLPEYPHNSNDLGNLFKSLSYNQLPQFLNDRQAELSPRSLLAAKRRQKQLALFDTIMDASELEEFARKVTRKTMVETFESTIAKVSTSVRTEERTSVTRLAIWMLAARILQDKLVDEQSLRDANHGASLLNAAQNLHPQYFVGIEGYIQSVGEATVETLYTGLRDDITFRSLTNDMLAYFYEYALVDENLRKQLGIYYTPRKIAEEILSRLPIEDLRPEDRTIFDGTCGSGNLLLAGYDRLSQLLPYDLTLSERHEYLLKHIIGMDKDTFACDVARVSLFNYNLPAGNSWQIYERDILTTTIEDLPKQPNIIVGNPPFAHDRKEGATTEKAAAILKQYIDWLAPNGYLGIVLPRTILHINSAVSIRKLLLDKCDILDVLHLPEGVFGSKVATAIITAKKLPSEVKRTHFFLSRVDDRVASLNYVVPQEQWISHKQHNMTSSELEPIFRRLEEVFKPMDPTFCKIRNGVIPGEAARKTHFSEIDNGVGWRKALVNNRQGRTLSPYMINWQVQQELYIKYPSAELQWSRTPSHFDIPTKVILNSIRNAGNWWRLCAAVDSSQYVVTENYDYILPSEGTTSEEIAAVLNSMFANCWYSNQDYQPKIKITQLRKLPFPHFTNAQRSLVCELVRKITSLKAELILGQIQQVNNIMVTLDEIVFEAYGLEDNEQAKIRIAMRDFKRPGLEESDPIESKVRPNIFGGRSWKVSGGVEDVNVLKQTICLWTQNSASVVEIDIPSSMPGWMLRPGAAFVATIPWEERKESDLSKLTWLSFQPLDYGYMSGTELVGLLK